MEAFLAPFTSFDGIFSLFTLILLEIILGIDNIIFIAIICGYLPQKKSQQRARFIGLAMALVARVILLSTISWITQMKHPFAYLGPVELTGRGVILFAGGGFLIVKTMIEIYHKFKIADKEESAKSRQLTMPQAILQITFIDIVFSFDSIITAVGVTANHPRPEEALAIMIIAVVIAMIAMLMFAPYVSTFIEKYPTLKMLALTFLVVIGLILVMEALESARVIELPHGVNVKTYAYIALFFSLTVEALNIRLRNVNERRNRS